MLISEFLEYSQLAWNKVHNSDPRSPLRYGQALWNILPEDFLAPIYQTDMDFYYFSNNKVDRINTICYQLCDDYYDMLHLGVI